MKIEPNTLAVGTFVVYLFWTNLYVCSELIFVRLFWQLYYCHHRRQLCVYYQCMVANHYLYCKSPMPFLHVLISILNVIVANFRLSIFFSLSPHQSHYIFIYCYRISHFYAIQFQMYFNIYLIRFHFLQYFCCT